MSAKLAKPVFTGGEGTFTVHRLPHPCCLRLQPDTVPTVAGAGSSTLAAPPCRSTAPDAVAPRPAQAPFRSTRASHRVCHCRASCSATTRSAAPEQQPEIRRHHRVPPRQKLFNPLLDCSSETASVRDPVASLEFDAVAVSLLPSLARGSCRTPSASVSALARSPICRAGTPISPPTRLQPAPALRRAGLLSAQRLLKP
ncbi:hypothetical protein EUGRSUZ_L00701 [Eucalyptus grandis]|uniref:Uncharacterized protein n=1 Tax=Eucalyptus grandis TaxID=71139 RepID=A0A058ZVT9_EUCGR|nr:hypothetical protein EUGRSUZ_L00701 [Eucalyptus grandis]